MRADLGHKNEGLGEFELLGLVVKDLPSTVNAKAQGGGTPVVNVDKTK